MNPAVILAVLFFPVFLVLSALWSGYVLSVMWTWFMVPVFNLPALPIPAAIGVSLVMGMLTHQHPRTDDSVSDTYTHGVVMALIGPALLLFTGWVVQHWM